MSKTRSCTPRRTLPCLLVALVWLGLPPAVRAQSGGDAAAAWGGGAVGALSGLTLGVVGAMPPCSLTFRGARCARVAATIGGLIGSAGGAVIGYHDPDELHGRLLGAGLGAATGVALGLGARGVVRQIELRDIATLTLVGAGLGAVPMGSGVGLGAGLLAGSALWLISSDYGLPETVAIGVAGMALGGLMEWAYAAFDEADASGPFVTRLSLRF